MRTKQLKELGVPDECYASALAGIQSTVKAGRVPARELKQRIAAVVADPERFRADPHFAALAEAILEVGRYVPLRPIDYRTWGDDIDEGSHVQMRQACSVPGACGAALMPDAHVGYGLPIGGVLAVEGAVIPYAVGVDIACRMKLSVLDAAPQSLTADPDRWKRALEKGTRFGVGVGYDQPQEHSVMDRDWTITRITREHRDRAWRQLGTSGSGNHFVEFGVLTIDDPQGSGGIGGIGGADEKNLGLPPGQYTALLSHSGSRGAGAAVCNVYSNIARARLPRRYAELGRLAWLDLDSEAGREYWMAMNLMGEYAAANHDVIHRNVSRLAAVQIIGGVENHHNFAWKEAHDGREVIVHRKGATPAGNGVLGVIPGSMAAPAYVVRGLGNPASLDSASHGAGRRMSRTAAKSKYSWNTVRKQLASQGVEVLSAGSDEVPGVYKDIEAVMNSQRDLVAVVGRFDPKIVKMCGDGSKAED